MFFLGDSVDRSAVWDVNSSAFAKHTPGLESMIAEHWRAAIKLPNLDMVSYHGSASTFVQHISDLIAKGRILNLIIFQGQRQYHL